ncbi:MAG: alpha/beta hydrolase [Chthoniobacterales bacterium]|nr:alpha/beta hydrolase [Chthoniobacterales bacterium]
MLEDDRPSLHSRLWRIVRAVVLVWLILVAFFALAQRSMIYFPTKDDATSLHAQASASGLIPWTNAHGEVIGYRTPPEEGAPLPPASVVIFHGNAGHAIHRADYAQILRGAAPERALSVFILEYPGYGARSGNPSQETILAAAEDAIHSLPEGAPVILLGESIGTGVAAAMAAKFPARIAGLLLLTPFNSLVAAAQHHYPLLPVRWILRDKYPSADWLKSYTGPVSVVLAAKDTIVPAELGRKLYDGYSGPKHLFTAQGADHNDLLYTLTPADWRSSLGFLLPRSTAP